MVACIMSKHKWHVDGSHESEIEETKGWARLKLICIADHECGKTASVFVDDLTNDGVMIDE